MSGPGQVRVVVAEDQPLVRSGLVLLLQTGGVEVVAEAGDGAEAVDLARTHRPDVVVMDLQMPGVDGVAATRQLTTDTATSPQGPGGGDDLVKVLVVTTYHEDQAVYGALRAGASGYLLKSAAPRDLLPAVRAVASGEAWIDPAVAGAVIAALAELPERSAPTPQPLQRLTPRETEVLALVALGLSNTEIKDHLVLSEATVKTHVSRILIKTGSRDRAQAVALAYTSGLVTPPRNASRRWI